MSDGHRARIVRLGLSKVEHAVADLVELDVKKLGAAAAGL
jgi:hypothetical protein